MTKVFCKIHEKSLKKRSIFESFLQILEGNNARKLSVKIEIWIQNLFLFNPIQISSFEKVLFTLRMRHFSLNYEKNHPKSIGLPLSFWILKTHFSQNPKVNASKREFLKMCTQPFQNRKVIASFSLNYDGKCVSKRFRAFWRHKMWIFQAKLAFL